MLTPKILKQKGFCVEDGPLLGFGPGDSPADPLEGTSMTDGLADAIRNIRLLEHLICTFARRSRCLPAKAYHESCSRNLPTTCKVLMLDLLDTMEHLEKANICVVNLCKGSFAVVTSCARVQYGLYKGNGVTLDVTTSSWCSSGGLWASSDWLMQCCNEQMR